MELSEAFLRLGAEDFRQLVRGISIGKLKTYELYESFKTRARLGKVNAESLRAAVPRFWQRISERDEEFSRDLAQAMLLSHLDMVQEVLDFLGIPNQDGFFAKDLDASQHLTDGWQQRAWEQFREKYPPPPLLLYLNHLAWELEKKDPQYFAPSR